MAPILNELAELLYEFGPAHVGTGNAPEVANRARRNARRRRKVGYVNRHTMFVQGTRDRNNNARDPTQNQYRTFQRIPCYPASELNG
ncbi:MAG: hypothetical protein ABSG72_24140 [Candidatus Sulfotelmatobacter sp.]|jgi:hypothetical protein